jgi:hypothetical protein
VTSLIELTSFDYVQGVGYLPVYVNAMHVAYIQSRRGYNSQIDCDELAGTLLYFQQEDLVLAVRESVDEVLAVLGA